MGLSTPVTFTASADSPCSLRVRSPGPINSSFLCFRPWGFNLPDISRHIPVSVWHGDKDYFIPFAVGEFVARQMPSSVWHPLPGVGHFYVFENAVNAGAVSAFRSAKHKQQLLTASKSLDAANPLLKQWLVECRDLARQTKNLHPNLAKPAVPAAAASPSQQTTPPAK